MFAVNLVILTREFSGIDSLLKPQVAVKGTASFDTCIFGCGVELRPQETVVLQLKLLPYSFISLVMLRA